MSSNLYWRPPEPDGKPLGDSLKFALRKYFDGTFPEWQILDSHAVGFLHGVIAATDDKQTAEDAQMLIDKIEKFGHVEVAERY